MTPTEPLGVAQVSVEKPASVRARLAEERRDLQHLAWLAGYEACKRGKQMHSPYAREHHT